MSLGERGPVGRLHWPRYRESACYYQRDERCPLCWARSFWFILPPRLQAVLVASLVLALAAMTTVGLWLLSGGWGL